VRVSPQRQTSSFARKPLVSVCTPSVPERAEMLAELRASVDAQTMRDWEHLVMVDAEYQGCSRTLNQIAAEAHGDWLFLVADDDLLLPDCLAAHLAASAEADVVYSPPVVEGEPEAPFHGEPPGIPSSALIRKTLWDDLGGYDVDRAQCEDYDFFERALGVGARFVRIPEQAWVYRFHGKNKSRAPWAGVRS